MLDQVGAGGNMIADGLELIGGAGDEEVALLRGADLRLDLSGIREGDVHLAAGFSLEGVRDLLERLGHASAAIDVEAFALKGCGSGLLRLLGLLLALVGGASCQHAAGKHAGKRHGCDRCQAVLHLFHTGSLLFCPHTTRRPFAYEGAPVISLIIHRR